LMGAGRTELLTAVFGAWPGRYKRQIAVDGKDVRIDSPADAIRHGIGFVTEDRKRFGLILEQTILDNMTLAGLRRISGRFITSVDAESAAGGRSMKGDSVKSDSRCR